jgi:hypothetical protein
MIPSSKKSIYLDINACQAGRIMKVNENLAGPFFTKAQANSAIMRLKDSGKIDQKTYLRLNLQIKESRLDGVPPYSPKATSRLPIKSFFR